MRTIMTFVVASLCALAATAEAQSKKTAGKKSSSGPNCTPTCYEAEPADKGGDLVACGLYTKGFCQMKQVGGWSAAELNQGATPQDVIKSCKFPAAPKAGKWVKMSNTARSILKSDMRPGDVVFIPAKAAWGESTIGDDPARCVDVHWYSKKHHFDKTKCGELSDAIGCEASGSKTAKAINMIQFRFDEAKTASGADDKDTCQAAAGIAVALSRGIVKFKKDLEGSGDWRKGMSYKTRYSGKLSEKDLFAKIDKLGKDALALFKTCGGDKPPSGDDEMGFTK